MQLFLNKKRATVINTDTLDLEMCLYADIFPINKVLFDMTYPKFALQLSRDLNSEDISYFRGF